jgi:hypothetical protein
MSDHISCTSFVTLDSPKPAWSVIEVTNRNPFTWSSRSRAVTPTSCAQRAQERQRRCPGESCRAN